MKKILITGSGGVLGTLFKDKIFIKQNKKYTFVFSNSKKCDLRNYTKTLNYIKKLTLIIYLILLLLAAV